ncbi:hypothetical protein KRX54_05870 [Actinomycetaceae bacterium TAE3-ERU4]|nr:hypothetical protein [Actinomycetaceae bacterium TAE3-ERU4]
MGSISDLFTPAPQQYELRGNKRLWDVLCEIFEKVPMPNDGESLIELIHAELERQTGISTEAYIAAKDASFDNRDFWVHLPHLDTGGMSGGFIILPWWEQIAIPLLVSRFAEV